MQVILALLIKELGAPLARNVFERLSRSATQSRIKDIEALIRAGSTAISALRAVLGRQFDEALLASTTFGPRHWTFEAGRKDYVRLPLDPTDDVSACMALREELGLNLARVAALKAADPTDPVSHVRGCLRVWTDRFEQRFRPSASLDRQALSQIRRMLTSAEGRRSKLRRLLGVSGVAVGLMLLLKAGMLLLSIGVGLLVAIKAWLFGAPFLIIATLFVGGVILTGCGLHSSIRPTMQQDLAGAIDSAYGLLDKWAVQAEVYR